MREASARACSHIGSRQSLWWAFALLGGPAATLLPDLLFPQETRLVKFLLTCACLYLLGGFLGYVASGQPWKWAIACLLLIPIVDALRAMLPIKTLVPAEFAQQLIATWDKVIYYVAEAIAVFVGALVGGAAERRR